ncbi:hypothetical protein Tco_0304530 [Tanacetum coccineum]
MTTKAQQIELDNALVTPENRHVICKCNMRINLGMKPKEPTYQHKSSYQFKIDKKRFSVNVEVLREILNICPKVPSKEFDEPPTKEEALSFILYIMEKQDVHEHCLDDMCTWYHECFSPYMQTLQELNLQCQGKVKKKSESAISSAESPSKKKFAKAKKDAATKPKSTKKKEPVKAAPEVGLNVLLEVALSEAAQLKEATKRSKKDLHISQASGSGDGTNFELGVPDEQHLKTIGVDEGTSTIPGVPDVPKYEYESEKESWGDSREEDEDDKNDSQDKSDDGKDDDDANDDDDDDANDDDNQEGDDMNDDDEETDSDRTESNRIKIPVLNQSTTEYYEEEEEEKIDDEETMDEEDDEVTKELYDDVNVNLGNEDTDMTNADQGASEQQNVSQESGFEQVEEDAHVTLTSVLDTQKVDEPVQSSFVSSDFTSKLLNLENPSPADNEIASLMETSARRATTVPKITSGFTTTIPLPPPHQLEKDLSKIKQIDQYAQALSSIHAIVDRYIDNKIREAINKAIQAHNLDCRQESQDEKNEYIGVVDTSMRTIIKEEVTTQLPQILPQAVSDFATPVIEKNVTKSLEAAVLARSSSQPKSTYAVAASLSEFELTKILVDKMEESKSHLRVDYKKKLYDALVESYNTNKDLFNTYGEVFTLKRSRDNSDKDRDPSAGSDRGTKRRKSSKEAKSSKDSSQVARTSVNELMDTFFDFSAFVLNWLNIKDLTQEILVGPELELLKGTCMSLIELEYHLEEYHRGRQVIPYDFFINNDLEYLKGGHLSRRYSTSVTKTKTATYEIKWIEDLVRNFWSPVKVIYDKHAYWGTSHWGPKRQHFYGFAANMSSSTDVYSRKRIIAITRLTIMKRQRRHVTYTCSTKADQSHNRQTSALNDIAKGIRMEYLPKRKLSGLDKRRAWVMVQDIDKQLYERRLMQNLKKFVGGIEYGNDLRLLERTI